MSPFFHFRNIISSLQRFAFYEFRLHRSAAHGCLFQTLARLLSGAFAGNPVAGCFHLCSGAFLFIIRHRQRPSERGPPGPASDRYRGRRLVLLFSTPDRRVEGDCAPTCSVSQRAGALVGNVRSSDAAHLIFRLETEQARSSRAMQGAATIALRWIQWNNAVVRFIPLMVLRDQPCLAATNHGTGKRTLLHRKTADGLSSRSLLWE